MLGVMVMQAYKIFPEIRFVWTGRVQWIYFFSGIKSIKYMYSSGEKGKYATSLTFLLLFLLLAPFLKNNLDWLKVKVTSKFPHMSLKCRKQISGINLVLCNSASCEFSAFSRLPVPGPNNVKRALLDSGRSQQPTCCTSGTAALLNFEAAPSKSTLLTPEFSCDAVWHMVNVAVWIWWGKHRSLIWMAKNVPTTSQRKWIHFLIHSKFSEGQVYST